MKCRLVFLLGLLVLSHAALSAETVIGENTHQLSPDQISLDILRDATGKLTAEEAYQSYRQGRFTTYTENPALGYTKDTVWVALSVLPEKNSSEQWVLELEPTTLDYIKAYRFSADGILDEQTQISGDGVPPAYRSIASRKPVFRLTIADQQFTLLLQVKTTSQMTLVPFLKKQTIFEKDEQIEILWIGLYQGFMLTSMVFSLIAWRIIKQHDYFTYAFYILINALFWLSYNGLTGLYLLPNHPVAANQLLGVLLCFSVIIGNYFFKKLLDIDKRFKISILSIHLVNTVSLVSAASIFSGFFAFMFPLLLGSIVLSFFIFGGHSIRHLRNNDSDKIIFSLAYLLFGMANNLTILMNFGLLTATLFTLYIAQAAQLIHILAIHTGLYRQFRNYQQMAQQAEFDITLLNKQLEFDQQLSKDQHRLLQMIEHEIRTPISIINASAQSLRMLDNSSKTDPERSKRYEKIYRAVKRLELLVSLSKMGMGNDLSKTQLTEVNPVNILQSVLDYFDSARHRFIIENSVSIPTRVSFDIGYLDFVMTNLIDNALKYSPADTPVKLQIVSKSIDAKPGIQILICNQTHHSLANHATQLFEKFSRFDEESGEPGLGMGLFLCQQLVSKNQGEIAATCPDEQHLCMRIWLPQID